MTITTRCQNCGEPKEIEVDEHEYKNWKDGELIQKAMPTLTSDQRELLISGTCGKCWKDLFGE